MSWTLSRRHKLGQWAGALGNRLYIGTESMMGIFQVSRASRLALRGRGRMFAHAVTTGRGTATKRRPTAAASPLDAEISRRRRSSHPFAGCEWPLRRPRSCWDRRSRSFARSHLEQLGLSGLGFCAAAKLEPAYLLLALGRRRTRPWLLSRRELSVLL